MLNKSVFVALAWPETKVRKVGVWYDPILSAVGVNDGTYYKVGHAALLLINRTTNKVHYFDFGRYHTPLKHGRVRDEETDPELKINTPAKFDNKGNLINIKEILLEVSTNRATHGSGFMLASVYQNISFEKAYSKAKEFQNKGAISYGPFDLKGTNCSRFVASVAKHSGNDFLTKLLIKVPYTISPSPVSNIKVINSFPHYYKVDRQNGVQEIEHRFLKIKNRKNEQ